MKFKPWLLAAGLAACTIGAAHADQTWNWSYTGVGVAASGTFTTAGSALVFEDILSFTGTRNNAVITGLVPLDQDPLFAYDNQFRFPGEHFTDSGLLFSVAGGTNVNLYFFGGEYLDLTIDGLNVVEGPVTFNVAAAVPEPATALSLLAGLGLVGATLRSRRREG